MTLPGAMFLAGVVGYLIGGIPVGVLVARLHGVNILAVGSGNIGAANVGRNLGFRWGLVVFLFDVSKGLVPTAIAGPWLGSLAGPNEAWACVGWLGVGLCAILGHNHSPYLGFRGGKGVATSFGVALGVFPHLTVPALAGLATWATVVGLTRISSAGSILGAAVFPITYLAISWVQGWDREPRWPFVVFALATAGLILLRHRANFARILKGTEARLERSTDAQTSAVADDDS